MSLQDMTADEVIASIHNALEQELQKQHPISPSYHSGHVALSYKIGATEERERIIKLLESKLCSCLDLPDDQTFADREELMKHMNCDWEAMMIEYHVALIKGERK